MQMRLRSGGTEGLLAEKLEVILYVHFCEVFENVQKKKYSIQYSCSEYMRIYISVCIFSKKTFSFSIFKYLTFFVLPCYIYFLSNIAS